MSDKPKVVSLRGGPVPEPGQKAIDKDTVEELKLLLEAAENGEVTGLAAVYVSHDDMADYSLTGNALSYVTIGLLSVVSDEVKRQMFDDED